MGRPTSKPRLPELDPDAEALAFTRSIFQHYREGVGEHLAPVCSLELPEKRPAEESLRRMPIFEQVRRLAAFAIRGERLGQSLEQLLKPLQSLASSPLWERVDIAGIAANTDPNIEESPIKLIIAGAFARAQILERKHPVTSAQVAILAGMSRRNMGRIIADGGLPTVQEGRQGTHGSALISPAIAGDWLCERKIPGFEKRTRKA
jgi:hypothetical protein